MLLLRKKKYAAVKLQFKDGKTCEVIFNSLWLPFLLENVLSTNMTSQCRTLKEKVWTWFVEIGAYFPRKLEIYACLRSCVEGMF